VDAVKKRVFLAVAVVWFLAGWEVRAKDGWVGIQGGVTWTDITGNDMRWATTMRQGWTGGICLLSSISENSSGELDVLYAQKGASYKTRLQGESGTSDARVDLKQDYLEIPLLIRLNHPIVGRLSGELIGGFTLGFNITSTRTVNFPDSPGTTRDLDDTRLLDFGGTLGAALKFYWFHVEGRYTWGWTTTDGGEHADKYEWQNRTVTLMLGIRPSF